jgi:ubiquinone/menaquinone biosynthesis C-methylase UbiE
MTDYYRDTLSADRLRRCYELAPPRVQRYLEAELIHVREAIRPTDVVLELGCGYGRILPELARKAALVVGIDTSPSSLRLARKTLGTIRNCVLLEMDALKLPFPNNAFDTVVCIQNGISAFHVDKGKLIRASLRVTRRGGTVLFSSYSQKFWADRLEWFEIQSHAGLLGEIDRERTTNGVIVCKDGFTSSTVTPDQFISLTSSLDADVSLVEVDESSLFCELVPR